MKFSAAIKALEEGKKIRCCLWEKGEFWSSYSTFKEVWSDCEYRVKRMMKEEWELYEEPQKTYSFAEVVKGLREGKKFRRTKDHISMDARENGSVQYSGVGLARGFFLEDFEATDWVEVL